MRRLLSLAALLLCLCLLAGCGENEPIPLEYTSSVVIETERPDPSLVWAGRFQTPTSGMGKINFADSAFFGVVRAGEIAEHKLGDQRDLCPAYHTGSLWKLLGWTGEAYREQIGVYIDSRSYTSWHDAVLFHFPVEAEHHQYKGKPVRYAGHYLLIEYRPAEEKVYFEAVPLEDFRNARPGALNALYRHRIGDRVYGRLLCGMAPWLEVSALEAVDPASPDVMNFSGGRPFLGLSLWRHAEPGAGGADG